MIFLIFIEPKILNVTMSVRRQLKNVVNNYSNAEVKVREATSNDPWGPSSSVMTEIADATYNVVAFSEIMGMIWKRLNDHGKNWRHVYKSLVVLDYIIKTGSERVAQQCRENLYAIQTLKDFQFIDKDGKDQGMNVREKAKQLVGLLKDEDRLKSERSRALKAKERFAQANSGIGSDSLKAGNLRDSGSTSDLRLESSSAPASTVPTSRSWEPATPRVALVRQDFVEEALQTASQTPHVDDVASQDIGRENVRCRRILLATLSWQRRTIRSPSRASRKSRAMATKMANTTVIAVALTLSMSFRALRRSMMRTGNKT